MLIRLSYVEVYNEEVFDLLAPTRQALEVRENPQQGRFYVEGASQHIVNAWPEAERLLQVSWEAGRLSPDSWASWLTSAASRWRLAWACPRHTMWHQLHPQQRAPVRCARLPWAYRSARPASLPGACRRWPGRTG